MNRLLLALALTVTSSHASDTILKNDLKVHTDMCQDGKCSLTKVFFHTIDHASKESDNPFPYYGTLLRAGFEAKSWDEIQEYGFVQQIRGCTFESFQEKGQTVRRIAEVIQHYNVKQTYVFPNWTYDANTLDPLYYGPLEEDNGLPGGRLALYEWIPQIGSYNKKVQLQKILSLPPTQREKLAPRLTVTDAPSMAYYSLGNKAHNNLALDFKICVYRLKDIPAEVNDQTVMPEPIVCHHWDSQFEFDFKKKKYVMNKDAGLHEFCASQTPKDVQTLVDELNGN